MRTSAMQPANRLTRAAVRAIWVTRLLLAAWAAAGPATLARAQTPGSVGPSFELTDHNGRAFSSAALVGQP
jgi:cytochrome oxidase Cu insertion factor (SCO1/SenC/PrrC family)